MGTQNLELDGIGCGGQRRRAGEIQSSFPEGRRWIIDGGHDGIVHGTDDSERVEVVLRGEIYNDRVLSIT